MEVTDNSSSIQMGAVAPPNCENQKHDSVHLHPLSATGIASALTPNTRAEGSGRPLKDGSYFAASTKMPPPGGAALEAIKERRKKFLVYSFLSLSDKVSKAPLMKTKNGLPEVVE